MYFKKDDIIILEDPEFLSAGAEDIYLNTKEGDPVRFVRKEDNEQIIVSYWCNGCQEYHESVIFEADIASPRRENPLHALKEILDC